MDARKQRRMEANGQWPTGVDRIRKHMGQRQRREERHAVSDCRCVAGLIGADHAQTGSLRRHDAALTDLQPIANRRDSGAERGRPDQRNSQDQKGEFAAFDIATEVEEVLTGWLDESTLEHRLGGQTE